MSLQIRLNTEVLENSEMPDVRRIITLQNAAIYNRFYELVVQPFDNNRRRLSDIVNITGASDQSSLTKQLKSLNAKFSSIVGSNLFWKSEDGLWLSTPMGDKLYGITRSMETEFNNFEKWIVSNAEIAHLVIAINAFSFHSFARIEHEMKRIEPNLVYKKHFKYYRSNRIFDKVKHKKYIDVGITESFNKIKTGSQLEVIEIDSSKISLLSNYNIPENMFDSEGFFKVEYLSSLPIIIGDTKSFMEYLFSIDKGGFREDYNVEDIPFIELKSYVYNKYNVYNTTESIHTMMDILLMGNSDVVMLATPEVRGHVEALEKSNSYMTDDLAVRKINAHFISDGDTFLRKYAVRKKLSEYQTNINVVELFWSGAKILAQNRFGWEYI